MQENASMGPHREKITLRKWHNPLADPHVDEPDEIEIITVWYDETQNIIYDEARIAELEAQMAQGT